MRELALFAGAGGGILGGYLLGWRTVCSVEIADYPRRVLLARQRDGILPRFPIWDDIKTFDGRPWRGRVDVITGGFPCQAYSSAARGRNVSDSLWPEMLRIISEVCPRYVFAENTSEDAIIEAQADLAEAGYKTNRAMLSPRHMGAGHNRRRWWVVADADDKSKLGSEKYAEMEGIKKRRCSVWATQPNESRVVDGMAHRMDRFKALGNGQVPAVAAFTWQALTHWAME